MLLDYTLAKIVQSVHVLFLATAESREGGCGCGPCKLILRNGGLLDTQRGQKQMRECASHDILPQRVNPHPLL